MKRVKLKPSYNDGNWHGWPPQVWDGKRWVYVKAPKEEALKPRAMTRKELEAGGRVRLRWNPDWMGKIIHLGPEQSHVRFDDGHFQFIVNEHLEAM